MSINRDDPDVVLYCAVASGTEIRAEHPQAVHLRAVALRILRELPGRQDTRLAYAYDCYRFHCVVFNEVVYICVTQERLGNQHRIAYSLLEDLKAAYLSGTSSKHLLEQMIERRMEHYNSGKGDKLKMVMQQVEQVKVTMLENVEKVIERGEKIDMLMDKTSRMNSESFKFRQAATRTKRQMCFGHFRLVLLVCALFSAVGIAVFLVLCKGLECLPDWTHFWDR
eukprot:TRINITY_DN42619_c0_g1_i1.p1 TRINITY_DN42619_c0_g1~~TRINITY_DN42619_c0_g1_i1.p1  ORF type:complete len:224 (+),score=41.51 TRINITY_DN42619_c0_g1_i1:52-723(+)